MSVKVACGALPRICIDQGYVEIWTTVKAFNTDSRRQATWFASPSALASEHKDKLLVPPFPSRFWPCSCFVANHPLQLRPITAQFLPCLPSVALSAQLPARQHGPHLRQRMGENHGGMRLERRLDRSGIPGRSPACSRRRRCCWVSFFLNY